jgi:hypothetical protein
MIVISDVISVVIVYLFSKFVICENEYCDKLGYVMNMRCWAADFSNIL